MTCSFCTDLAAARNENYSSALLGVIISGLKLYVLMKCLIFIKDLIVSMMPKVPSLVQLLLKRSCKTLIQLKSIKCQFFFAMTFFNVHSFIISEALQAIHRPFFLGNVYYPESTQNAGFYI
jgi:hypothetical protein